MKTFFLILFSSILVCSEETYKSIQIVAGQNLLTSLPVQVSSNDKKGLVVLFLSAKCPCSNSHNQEIADLSTKYKDFNFVAVHSNANEGLDISKPYFQKANFSFPVIEDSNARLADEMKASKTPHAFVFSPQGDALYAGGVSNSKDCSKADRKYLREALEDISSGQKVRTPEGRTLGCAITRGDSNVWK